MLHGPAGCQILIPHMAYGRKSSPQRAKMVEHSVLSNVFFLGVKGVWGGGGGRKAKKSGEAPQAKIFVVIKHTLNDNRAEGAIFFVEN